MDQYPTACLSPLGDRVAWPNSTGPQEPYSWLDPLRLRRPADETQYDVYVGATCRETGRSIASHTTTDPNGKNVSFLDRGYLCMAPAPQ